MTQRDARGRCTDSWVRLFFRLFLAAMVAVPLAVASPPTVPFALADDDDGGDDDGGFGGGAGGATSGGGGGEAVRSRARGGNPLRWLKQGRSVRKQSRTERPRARTERRVNRAATPVVLATQSGREIVALGQSERGLAELAAQGYQVLEQSVLTVISIRVARLEPPAGVTLEDARAAVAAADPDAIVDLNHFYRQGEGGTGAGQACDGVHCAAVTLVDWPLDPQGLPDSCGAPARIGIVDTGVNSAHATFDGRAIEVVTLDRAEGSPASERHGTAVASILVGAADTRTPGLVGNASLVAVNAFQREGADERADAYALLRALDVLADRDVQVVNLSLAGPANILLERAVAELDRRGVVLVAAAGNAGPKAEPAYPAAYAPVIAVTAIDQSRRIWRRAIQGGHIDFAAPGVNVWTAASVSGARTRTGTSFAAPFVTAAAALAKSRKPELSGRDIERMLAEAAADLGDPGRDPVFGHGLVQAAGLCAR